MKSFRRAFADRSVPELRQLAKDRGLSGYSKLRKDELITLLRRRPKPKPRAQRPGRAQVPSGASGVQARALAPPGFQPVPVSMPEFIRVFDPDRPGTVFDFDARHPWQHELQGQLSARQRHEEERRLARRARRQRAAYKRRRRPLPQDDDIDA